MLAATSSEESEDFENIPSFSEEEVIDKAEPEKSLSPENLHDFLAMMDNTTPEEIRVWWDEYEV